MELRSLVSRCVQLCLACGLMLAGVLLATNHQQAAFGLLFGVVIGVTNQLMLAVRVAGIGEYGTRPRTQAIMVSNMGMRFLMMGLATYLTIRLDDRLSFFGFIAGLMLTFAVTALVGARHFLKDNLKDNA